MDARRPTFKPRTWVTVGAVLATVVLVLAVGGGTGGAATVLPIVFVALTVAVFVWAVLHTRRERRQHEDRLAVWAADRAAQAERLHIARDLHDVVSHGLGLITVRAAATRRVAGPGSDPESASALADIERVSRETTTELRRMLTVLRTPDAASGPLRPAETLQDLPGIVREVHDGGVTATLDLPDLGAVSPGVQLTVCAIVREALDNVARHAGPTRAHVRVHRVDGGLVTSVRDEGMVDGWEPRPGAGHGLAGLQERVAALGGTLRADPTDAGFVLMARIPDGGVT